MNSRVEVGRSVALGQGSLLTSGRVFDPTTRLGFLPGTSMDELESSETKRRSLSPGTHGTRETTDAPGLVSCSTGSSPEVRKLDDPPSHVPGDLTSTSVRGSTAPPTDAVSPVGGEASSPQ